MKKECAIIIPVYKQQLDVDERLSLHKVRTVLSKYERIFVKPKSVEWNCERNEKTIDVDDILLSSRREYSNLVIRKEFYELFLDYQYILIYQLDALVFEDKLGYFCDMNYDYIGAPWWGGYEFHNEYGDKWFVGNGGFSLRKVESFISWLSCIGEEKEFLATCMMEDLFIAAYGQEYLKIPSKEVAEEFAFEINPEESFIRLNGKLPFGCHGWKRFGRNFWNDLFKKNGYCDEFMALQKCMNIQEDKEAVFLGEMNVRMKSMNKVLNFELLKTVLQSYFKGWEIENGCAIYGAGQYGLSTLNLLKKAGIKVNLILDNDEKKIGKEFAGVPIKSLMEFVRNIGIPIIVAAYKTNEMEEVLRMCGLCEDDFISIYGIQEKMIERIQ